MKRLIDANKLKEKGVKFSFSVLEWVSDADIDLMPTVDAVEVVRCKDCKHCMLWNKPIGEHIGDCRYRYMYSDYPTFQRVKEYDFCSYGEREETWEDGDEIDLE